MGQAVAAREWIAPERIYADADGKAVRAGDPSARTLLIARGRAMRWADAVAAGLVARDVLGDMAQEMDGLHAAIRPRSLEFKPAPVPTDKRRRGARSKGQG